MGGRGGSSGMGSSKAEGTKKFSFSVGNLPGTEKQKAWAQSIVDDALNTVNKTLPMRLREEGYMNKTVRKYYPKKGTEFIHLLENNL